MSKRAIFLIWILALAISAFAAPESKNADSAAKTIPAATKTDGDYVGSETCIGCHEDQQRRMKNTAMGKAMTEANGRTALEKHGCEACHGAGKAHVEAGGGKESIPIRFGKDSNNSVEEQNSACLSCHAKGNRRFWKASPHDARGMSCVDCHQVKQVRAASLTAEARFNAPLSDVEGVKKSQPELCLECHQMRRAQLQRSSHMPFREGKVTCTSCHNPHGTPHPAQLIQATVNENCYSCHAERRGPFLWGHPPVTENCGTCHETHGSMNPQLLKARVPRLCQECHNTFSHGGQFPLGNVKTSNGSPAGFNNKTLNRGCANCHSKIHGSNAPSGKFFVR